VLGWAFSPLSGEDFSLLLDSADLAAPGAGVPTLVLDSLASPITNSGSNSEGSGPLEGVADLSPSGTGLESRLLDLLEGESGLEPARGRVLGEEEAAACAL